jgi:hypothetical protein
MHLSKKLGSLFPPKAYKAQPHTGKLVDQEAMTFRVIWTRAFPRGFSHDSRRNLIRGSSSKGRGFHLSVANLDIGFLGEFFPLRREQGNIELNIRELIGGETHPVHTGLPIRVLTQIRQG